MGTSRNVEYDHQQKIEIEHVIRSDSRKNENMASRTNKDELCVINTKFNVH